MIQEKVQFDRSFGTAKAGPVVHRETQIDNGGIQTYQFVFEPELFLPAFDLTPAAVKEFQKGQLIKLPRAMLVGVREGGMAGGADAQVFEFALAASQTSANLPEGNGLAPAGRTTWIQTGSRN